MPDNTNPATATFDPTATVSATVPLDQAPGPIEPATPAPAPDVPADPAPVEPSVAVDVAPTSTEATPMSNVTSRDIQIAEPTPDTAAGESAGTTTAPDAAASGTPTAPAPVVAPHRGALVTYPWWDVYEDRQRSIAGVVLDVHDGDTVEVVWLGEELATMAWADLRPVQD